MSEPAVVPYCYRQLTRNSPTDDLDDVSCLYPTLTTSASVGRLPVRGWTLVRNSLGGLKWVPATASATATASNITTASTASIAAAKGGTVEAMETDQEAPTVTVTTTPTTEEASFLNPATLPAPCSSSSLASSSAPVSYYTDEQYERSLVSTEWTREETDYLLSLCDRYYHRLIVVAGHYAFCRGEGPAQQQQQRSLEDIRERYYQVMNHLRAAMGRSVCHYDKEGDKHRRLVLNGFLSRSPEVQAEEALLAEAMGAMRLALPQVLQDRERLLLCCGGLGQHLLAHAPTLPELCGGGGTTAGKTRAGGTGTIGTGVRDSGAERKNKRSSHPTTTSSSLAPPAAGDADGDTEGGGRRKRKKQSPNRPPPAARSRKTATATAAMSMAIDSDTMYGERSGMAGPGRRPKPVLASTVARSSLLKPLRVGLTRQVDKMLLELGLGVRPSIPTAKVMDRFNDLRLMMSQLLEAHKSAGITSASISLGTVTPPKEKYLTMTSSNNGGDGEGVTTISSKDTTQNGLAGEEHDEGSSTTGSGEGITRPIAHNRRSR